MSLVSNAMRTFWLDGERNESNCASSSHGHDLCSLLRGGASDVEIAANIDHIWGARDDRASALRSISSGAVPTTNGSSERRVEMHYIGG